MYSTGPRYCKINKRESECQTLFRRAGELSFQASFSVRARAAQSTKFRLPRASAFDWNGTHGMVLRTSRTESFDNI